MITPILVPKLGMTQANITVVKWSVGNGESVEKGESVVTIETAKVSYEIEAPASGVVFVLKRVKEKVKIGETLGVVAESREEFERYKTDAPQKSEGDVGVMFDESEEEQGVRLSFEDEGEEETASASPAVDVSGRNILKRIPFIGMRRTIADNLCASLHTGAQLTIVSETDMTELARHRKELLLDYPETRITFVDMLVKILAFALQEFPIINSAIVGDEIICWSEYNIGVAMALDEGLVVPVVRNADRKGLVEVSREIKTLARKARNNQLRPEHYEGGTFTLSSGGKVETDIITPIIKPPENAIMAIGKIGPRPAVYKGQLAVRTMTYLCLTHDHRAIDGVPASLFLGRVKEVIEEPKLFGKALK
jgi:pyruvate/2-oxoglutarate dehydrogenase complex dihydrolipoamide acyltransferase (E2) component